MNGDTISNVLNKCNHYGILFPVNIKKGNKSMLMKDKLLIAGATGLIGRAFIQQFADAYDITVLGRDIVKLKRYFPMMHCLSWEDLQTVSASSFDKVMNLCGENIGEKRWSPSVKATILRSRVETTQQLVQWINQSSKPIHLYQASAVGFCGATPHSTVIYSDEQTYVYPDKPKDFLQAIAKEWESEIDKCKPIHPVTVMRFGVVLKDKEGFLGKLRLSFLLGLGSVIGDGAQSFSWIHYKDLIQAINFLLKNNTLTGVFHLTSPNPATQKEVATWYASFLQRPLWLTTPNWLIRLLFGEMGETLINQGCAVISKRLQMAGFQFCYENLLEVDQC
jgi:uncharacterized protein (TIGR01777 family)